MSQGSFVSLTRSLIPYPDGLGGRSQLLEQSAIQVSVWAARPGRATLPQIRESVRRVSGPVFVRWASLTALAQGPPESNKQSRPPRSMA